MSRLSLALTRFHCDTFTVMIVVQDLLANYMPHAGHNHTGFGL